MPVPYGPMMRMGGRGTETGVVMAKMASFCLAFRRGSSCSSHCLQPEEESKLAVSARLLTLQTWRKVSVELLETLVLHDLVKGLD